MKIIQSKSHKQAGYTVLPSIDQDQYSNREKEGLEGPFRLRSGKVVYYDAKEGKYYDPGSDMYLEHDDYEAHNKDRNVIAASKKKKGRCWKGYEPTPGKEPYSDGSCRPKD